MDPLPEDAERERLRHLCLSFPAAEEKVSHGRLTFRARVIFAVYSGMTASEETPAGHRPAQQYPHSLLVKVDDLERPALEQDARFYLPAYYGPYGWLGLDLSAAPVDWQEVAELVDTSYREVSGPALVARLDAEGSPADRQ
ncbi:MmcQ/YjbR family DNA-binding protein [Oerskovia flava]|uniref:MmcQ/YjbR family DNA-binding protein n=1 Tax=Oerskovia flava TaxID=2986422 RepID=UPI002240DA27|nr:MmcQ/YjbR family DNA-binding protein [Oerskovia sp. JB1-3-2]